jgi:hypothetical protein
VSIMGFVRRTSSADHVQLSEYFGTNRASHSSSAHGSFVLLGLKWHTNGTSQAMDTVLTLCSMRVFYILTVRFAELRTVRENHLKHNILSEAQNWTSFPFPGGLGWI